MWRDVMKKEEMKFLDEIAAIGFAKKCVRIKMKLIDGVDRIKHRLVRVNNKRQYRFQFVGLTLHEIQIVVHHE